MRKIAALFLALTLSMPHPALALRNEASKETGLEEDLRLALAKPDPLQAATQVIADRFTHAIGIPPAFSSIAAGVEEIRLINSEDIRPRVREAIAEFLHQIPAMEEKGPVNQFIHAPFDLIWERVKDLTEAERVLLTWIQFRYAVLDQYQLRKAWEKDSGSRERYPVSEYDIGYAIEEWEQFVDSPVWSSRSASPKDRVLFLLDLQFAYRARGEFPDQPDWWMKQGKEYYLRRNRNDLLQARSHLDKAEKLAKRSARDLLPKIEEEKAALQKLLGRNAAGAEELGRPEVPTYRRALLLGGVGNIGRGHIAPMLGRDGFDILFIDFNQSLIAAANQRDSYVVTPVGGGEPMTVRHFWGIAAQDQERVAAQGPRADWIFATVGTDNIIKLRDVVYRFIRNRVAADHLATLNIVFAENLPIDQPQIAALRQVVLDMSDSEMARYVQDHVNFIGAPPVEEFQEYEQNHVGWPGAVVSITVPPTLAKTETGNPLDISVEGGGPYELVVDGKELKNTPVVPSGIKLVDNIRAAREKKLLIHNMGHATFAYLAWILGMEPTGNPALAIRQDPRIARILRRAMEESAVGLLHRYPAEFTRSEMDHTIDELLNRFANVELNDTVERIARDPLRKLAKNDRLIGAAISAREAGIVPEAILLAVAAAIRYAQGQGVPNADLQAVRQQIQDLGFALPETQVEFQTAFDRLAAGAEESDRQKEIGAAVERFRVERRPSAIVENSGYYLEGEGIAFAPILALLEAKKEELNLNSFLFSGVVETRQDRDRLLAVVDSNMQARKLILSRIFVVEEQEAEDLAGRYELAKAAAQRLLMGTQIQTVSELRQDWLAQLNAILNSFGYRLPDDPSVQRAARTLLEAA